MYVCIYIYIYHIRWTICLSEDKNEVVTASDRAEFDHPMMWMRSPVHQGDFGLESVRGVGVGVE